MRGDRPYDNSREFPFPEFTPHARGSTPFLECKRHVHYVYPACAGIDPFDDVVEQKAISLPRMRGDRPMTPEIQRALPKFTPHARGSTILHRSDPRPTWVYPACAGIDLSSQVALNRSLSLPRMRGDRP